jgi:hypothetical protein
MQAIAIGIDLAWSPKNVQAYRGTGRHSSLL